MFKCLPFLGYKEVPDSLFEYLELDASYNWKMFCFEWFDYGLTIWVKPNGLKEINNN